MPKDDRDEDSWTEWKRLVLDSIKRHEQGLIDAQREVRDALDAIYKKMEEERKDREQESRKLKWAIVGGIVSLAGQFIVIYLKK